MSYYEFGRDDIIYTTFQAQPSYIVENNGGQVTGSVYLEKPFQDSGLATRAFFGFSEKEGGLSEKHPPFTSSVDFVTAVSGATNSTTWFAVKKFYDYYSGFNTDYQPYYTGSLATTFRIVTIPEIYYDRSITTGTFTASDYNAAGTQRFIYDNGRGGLYSGSLSGTLVGHIFYSEGIAVLTKGDLNDFATVSPNNNKWRVQFRGTHNIPTTIYRCRAPAGELNATTNESFFYTPTTGDFKNCMIPLSQSMVPFISTVGLYNEDYELVGMARLAKPVKKNLHQDVLIKLRLDW